MTLPTSKSNTKMDCIVIYLFILVVTYIIIQKILQKFKNLPPSPFPTIPILGHLHLLKNPNTIHHTFSKLSQKYGPVVSLQLGSRQTILVSSSSAAEDCLLTNDATYANRPEIVGSNIFGYGRTSMIWAPYGPRWRAHRKIAHTEILSPYRVNSLLNIRVDEVKFLIKQIYVAGEDHVYEIKQALMELTNNVMLRMIAGKRIYGIGGEVESKEGKRFNDIITKALYSGLFCAVDFFPFLKYLGMQKSAEKRFQKIFVGVDGFFQELVDEQRKKLDDDDGDGDGNNNLIQVLLKLRKTDPEDSINDDMIKGLLEDLLLAGSEATSSTMEWALALLLRNPDLLECAKKEINETIGTHRLIVESDLANLPYLHCIINETLRMYPPGPLLIPHESSSDCVVGGYHIPKGTMLFLNLWAIQNDPKVWVEPTKFNPGRFDNVKGDRVGYDFMPFGSGRRACPGENLAMPMVGLVLGSLIQCFDLESVGEIDMEEIVSATMWKAKPLQAKFRPYDGMVELLSRTC